MKNFFRFGAILCLSLELCCSTTPKPLLLSPTRPTEKDQLIIQKIEATQKGIEFECSTPGHSHEDEAIEGGGWDDGFYVQIGNGFTPEELAVINAALYDLDQILCIGLFIVPQQSNPSGNYAFIKKGDPGSGCFSEVGNKGKGKQTINLAPGCLQKYIVTHECIHALGFYHEQSRADRDNHIDIFWENIQPSMEHNFFKKNASTFDIPYDVSSIMHYQSFAFARNTTIPTILKKNGGVILPNKAMTSSDNLKLQRMYNCF